MLFKNLLSDLIHFNNCFNPLNVHLEIYNNIKVSLLLYFKKNKQKYVQKAFYLLKGFEVLIKNRRHVNVFQQILDHVDNLEALEVYVSNMIQ